MNTSMISLVSTCSDAAAAIACLWMAISIDWSSVRQPGPGTDRRRIASVLSLTLFAICCFGTGELAGDIDPMGLLPLALKLAGAAGAVTGAGLLWWILRSHLASDPRASEAAGVDRSEGGPGPSNAEPTGDLFGRLNSDLDDIQRRFSLALQDAQIALVQQDTELRTTWTYTPPGSPVLDLLTAPNPREIDALPILPDDPDRRSLAAARRVVLTTGRATRFEDRIQVAGKTHWYEGRVEPLTRDGELVGLMSVALDVTRHKESEQHLHTVMRELTHRSKNLLAVVQGIARQTSRVTSALPDFVERFSARLQALARSQDLLISRSWRGADLRDLLIREFGDDSFMTSGRITIEGDAVALGADATQNVALAIHELAANALMHGALSVVDGRVEIAWRRTEIDGEPTLEFNWREIGGPPVAEPQRRGFGRIMVQQLLPRALGGTSELQFEPNGVIWLLRFPASRLAEDSR